MNLKTLTYAALLIVVTTGAGAHARNWGMEVDDRPVTSFGHQFLFENEKIQHEISEMDLQLVNLGAAAASPKTIDYLRAQVELGKGKIAEAVAAYEQADTDARVKARQDLIACKGDNGCVDKVNRTIQSLDSAASRMSEEKWSPEKLKALGEGNALERRFSGMIGISVLNAAFNDEIAALQTQGALTLVATKFDDLKPLCVGELAYRFRDSTAASPPPMTLEGFPAGSEPYCTETLAVENTVQYIQSGVVKKMVLELTSPIQSFADVARLNASTKIGSDFKAVVDNLISDDKSKASYNLEYVVGAHFWNSNYVNVRYGFGTLLAPPYNREVVGNVK